MRIGIDAHSAERDGTGNCTYTRNLILHLSAIDRENQYVLFVTDTSHPFYTQLRDRSNLEIVSVRRSPAWFRVFFSMAAASYRKKIDLLHVQYFAPFLHRGVLFCTIHDLASYRFPEYFSRLERFMFRTLLPVSVKKADLVLTASAVSKNDLISLLHLPEEKIRITYCGVSDVFFSNTTDEEKEKITEAYGLKKKFLLYVGRIDPRKNLARLIDAYARLRRERSLDYDLAIVGKVYLEPADLQQSLVRSGYREDIHFCGYVPDKDLAVLYSAADAFVYTSEFEGFGLPPLEAMASGTPVIASDIPIFKEILGDAAILVNPLDVASIEKGIFQALSDCELRKSLIAKGKDRVKEFTWEKTANLTLQSFQEKMR
jgi:glycosyltransferase involved in cell wall biosynthesis